MEPRKALAFGLVSAGLAIGLVALDLVFGVKATVEAELDGEWVSVASTGDQGYDRPIGGGCIEDRFRITVDNHRPFAAEVEILVEQHHANGTVTLLRDTWDLDRFTSRTEALDVDDSVQTHNLNVRVGEQYLYACLDSSETPREVPA